MNEEQYYIYLNGKPLIGHYTSNRRAKKELLTYMALYKANLEAMGVLVEYRTNLRLVGMVNGLKLTFADRSTDFITFVIKRVVLTPHSVNF